MKLDPLDLKEFTREIVNASKQPERPVDLVPMRQSDISNKCVLRFRFGGAVPFPEFISIFSQSWANARRPSQDLRKAA